MKPPEEYRWSSVGYHVQTENKDNFLSTDFGLAQFKNKKTSYSEMLKYYRKFLYEKGGFNVKHEGVIAEEIINNEQKLSGIQTLFLVEERKKAKSHFRA